VPSAIVTFIADGGKGMDSLKFVTTNSEGVYATRLNEPGRYLVSVQKAGLAGEQQTVSHVVDVPDAPEFEHDIHMPLGSITGSVLDPMDIPRPVCASASPPTARSPTARCSASTTPKSRPTARATTS
jgi:hypothetical protein